MAIINERWPRDLAPETCVFGRSRNDVLQLSPVTRVSTVLRQGRPLWSAQLSWNLPNGDSLAKLRYYLELLDGFAGSVQIWNFASPYPYGLRLATNDGEAERIFWSYLGNVAPWSWTGFPTHWALDSTVLLAADAAAGATSISLTGLDPEKLVCVKGQYIQIGRRIYLCTDIVSSSVGGTATIPIAPALMAAATTGAAVRLVEAACEMRLAGQDFDESASAGEGLSRISASFVETVQDFS